MSKEQTTARKVLAGLVLCGVACSQQPEPQPLPPVPPALAPAPESGPTSSKTRPVPPPEASRERKPPESKLPPIVVEIDPGPPKDARPPTLVEAARAEKERRQKTDKAPLAVINNKNLDQYATGKLTYVDEEGAPLPEDAGEKATAEESGSAEEYWRDRVLRIRLDWRESVEQIDELEKRTAELRRRFYAEDDPFVRDSQIKPEWDLVLERLAEARADSRRYPLELSRVMDEARRADAKQEWLDEGVEIEPQVPIEEDSPLTEPDLPYHEVQEPPELDEDSDP